MSEQAVRQPAAGQSSKRSWKVVCLGLDGATLDLIRPWAAQGRLPTFARLMREGACGELRSVIQPCPAQAWTSFMTGKNPGKHGIFGFRKQVPGSYKHAFVNGNMVRAKAIWHLLSEQERPVIVINVPLTYPPDPVKGCLVSGMDAAGVDSDFTYPAALKDELMRATGGRYVITVHLGGALSSDRKRRLGLQRLLDMEEARTEAALHLMKTRPWDLVMVKYDSSDQVQHYFWGHMDGGRGEFAEAVWRVYRQLDDIVARFLSEIDERTVLILLSDHGGGPHNGKVVHVNEWLRRQGLLAPRQASGRSGLLARTVGRTAHRSAHWLYYRLLLRVLSDAAKDMLWRRFPGLRAEMRHYLKFSFLDWSRTSAFLSGNLDTIVLNVKGREPQGVVEPGAEYELVRDRIIAGLGELRDPETGAPIFERIWRREEVYSGECVEEAPDLLLVPQGYSYSLSKELLEGAAPLVRRWQHHRGISGIHRMNGIVFLAGQPVRRGLELQGAEIVDLAPTILHLMGHGVPVDMDGRVLEEAIRDEFRRPVERVGGSGALQRQERDVYGPEEARTIGERLRGLGYID